MKLSDIIIITDLDGTVVPITGVISQKNIDAVKSFRDLGGIFTIATGRSPTSATQYCDALGITSFFIANNGASIFDINTQRTVWCKYLDNSYKDILHHVKEKFDYVGIQAITDDDVYHILVDYNFGEDFVRDSNFDYKTITEDELPNNCCKVLFQIDDEHFDDFTKYMYGQNYSNFNIVASGGDCFEMMASDISKGYPLEKLANFYDKSIECTAAIGDYYNDIEMIKKANIGAAVKNAPNEVKEIADVVVETCENDGLADFIQYLIKKYKPEDL